MTAARGPVLITGATGFVGQSLCRSMRQAGWHLRTPGRSDIGDIGPNTEWQSWLDGADSVVHLAARVHVMRESHADASAAYDRVNRGATARLATQAAQAGVRRFVFLSSVKVHGDRSEQPLTAQDMPKPADPYGRSKHAAELMLSDLAPDLETVILRPPLVYGPGVRGNFLSLMRLVDRGWPLPLGAVANRRSLIYLDNLVDAIHAALDAEPGIYLPSDRLDLSTPALVRSLAEALGKPARLFPAPLGLLGLAAGVLGRGAAVDRLCGSLTVDGRFPGWQPRVTPTEGFAATAAGYRQIRPDVI